MNNESTQHILERLASLLRNESRSLLQDYGLQPVQFEALRYLTICNRYSNSPMAVTEYLGLTKGSVSQSLKVLESKGLIAKSIDSKDKRVTHLVATDRGQTLVKNILPSPAIVSASKLLKQEKMSEINRTLATLLKAVQHANRFKSFGQCANCRHNIKVSNKEFLCGLTQETLSEPETNLICREHEQ